MSNKLKKLLNKKEKTFNELYEMNKLTSQNNEIYYENTSDDNNNIINQENNNTDENNQITTENKIDNDTDLKEEEEEIENDINNEQKSENEEESQETEEELPLITLNFISICQCCKNSFDNNIYKPYLLKCGHFFCIKCIKDYFSDQNGIKCPSDGLIAKSIDELTFLNNLIPKEKRNDKIKKDFLKNDIKIR
jgi:hypothetical protein